MNCTQCGYLNPEGSRFCRQCGKPLQAQAPDQQPAAPAASPQPPQPKQQPQPQSQYQPQTGAYPPQQPYASQQQPPYGMPPYQAAPRKKKTGLIIGLVSGGVVLVAAAVVLVLLFMGGTPVTGQWYCEEFGRALVFNEDNTVDAYGLTGAFQTDYTYDKGKAAGSITGSDGDYAFTVNKDALILDDRNGKNTFVKLKDGSDVEEYVLKAMEGLWSSEEIGEILKFNDGRVLVFSGYGDFQGTYDYDIEKGEGVFTVNNQDFTFSADYDLITVNDTGSYNKADSHIDVEAFVSQYAMPILGMWYDTSGTYGTIEFYQDGKAEVVMFGQPLTAEYTYDAATGTGTFFTDMTGETSPMTLNNDVIEIDGIQYTQDAVEQMSMEDLQGTVTGTWYETTGTLGTVTFYEDGSVGMDMYSEYYTGTYSYDPITGSGEIYEDTSGASTGFTLQDDAIYIEEVVYTRDYVEPATGILGMWYDASGMAGTINFYDDGSVLMETYGVQLVGTYAFDVMTDSGSMTVSYQDETLSCDLSLHQGILDVEGIQYTKDYVEQLEVTGP